MCVNDDTYIIELRSRDGKTPTGEYETLHKIKSEGGTLDTNQTTRYALLKKNYVKELSFDVNSQLVLSQLGNNSNTTYKARVTFFSLFQATGLNSACIDINVKEFTSGNVLSSDNSRGLTLATIPCNEHRMVPTSGNNETQNRPISFYGSGHSWIRINPHFSSFTVRIQNALSDNDILAPAYWDGTEEKTPDVEDWTLRIELVKV